MQAKKWLGQNFLIKDTIINKIVSLLELNENDLIIEIGPGKGALTKELSKLNNKVICFEIDNDMALYLNKYMSDHLEIIYNDFLNIDLDFILSKYKYSRLIIIGNLPYYITSPILEKLVSMNNKPDLMIFMVQKEVAQRYSALPKSRDYGYMSVFLQYYYQVDYAFTVDKTCFKPVPKVDSSVIKLTKLRKESQIDREEEFFIFLKNAFKQKRKTLKNNLSLSNWDEIKEVLKENNISERARAEEISLDIFIKIYNKISKL